MYYHTFIRFLTFPSHQIPFPVHADELGLCFKLLQVTVYIRSIHGRLFYMALGEAFCLIATRHPARSQVLQQPLHAFG